jgi:hypothetical protein
MTDHRKPYEKPTLTPIPYDSAADTLRHSRRVGELIGAVVGELVRRMTSHDLSKLGSIEKEAFDRMSPKLKTLTYGSDEYKASLKSWARRCNTTTRSTDITRSTTPAGSPG